MTRRGGQGALGEPGPGGTHRTHGPPVFAGLPGRGRREAHTHTGTLQASQGWGTAHGPRLSPGTRPRPAPAPGDHRSGRGHVCPTHRQTGRTRGVVRTRAERGPRLRAGRSWGGPGRVTSRVTRGRRLSAGLVSLSPCQMRRQERQPLGRQSPEVDGPRPREAEVGYDE